MLGDCHKSGAKLTQDGWHFSVILSQIHLILEAKTSVSWWMNGVSTNCHNKASIAWNCIQNYPHGFGFYPILCIWQGCANGGVWGVMPPNILKFARQFVKKSTILQLS